MSELREQIADIIADHCIEFIGIPPTAEDTHEYIADRILALLDKPDPQDCPTCRAIIEATLRVLDATPGGTDE